MKISYMKDSKGFNLSHNDLSVAVYVEKDGFFQQDNAAIHNASIAKKYLLEENIRLLDHPACSPDVNPTENLWGLIVVKVLSNFWTKKCNLRCMGKYLKFNFRN